jgi:hypothetical protein
MLRLAESLQTVQASAATTSRPFGGVGLTKISSRLQKALAGGKTKPHTVLPAVRLAEELWTSGASGAIMHMCP